MDIYMILVFLNVKNLYSILSLIFNIIKL